MSRQFPRFTVANAVQVEVSKIDRLTDLSAYRTVDPGHVDDLKKSMEESQLHQPILVLRGQDDRYSIVDGQHRLEAALALGWVHITARVIEGNEHDALFVGLTSNVRRRNLDGPDLAKALGLMEQLHAEIFGCGPTTSQATDGGGPAHPSKKVLAMRLNVSTTTVKRTRALRKLSQEARTAFEHREISPDVAHELAKLNHEQQHAILDEAKKVKLHAMTRDQFRLLAKQMRAGEGIPMATRSPAVGARSSATKVVPVVELALRGLTTVPPGLAPIAETTPEHNPDSDRARWWRLVEREAQISNDDLRNLTVDERRALLVVTIAARESATKMERRLEALEAQRTNGGSSLAVEGVQ